jgi:hypothetical protein
MTPTNPTTQKLEEDALLAGEVAAGALRGVEVAAVVLIGLLVCPPLAILVVVVVVVPLLLIALVLGLLLAVVTTPYLLVHHFRGHHDHLWQLARRLRHAARALIDLAPHRIVAEARRVDSGR